MTKYSFDLTIGELLKDQKSRAVVLKYYPSLAANPLVPLIEGMTVNAVLPRAGEFVDASKLPLLRAELEAL